MSQILTIIINLMNLNNNEKMLRTINGRKIYSVDSKRRRKKSNWQSEKISNKFFSSKNIFK